MNSGRVNEKRADESQKRRIERENTGGEGETCEPARELTAT